jgi:hypothetical protein
MKSFSFGDYRSRLFVGFAAFVLTSSAMAATAEKWRAIVSRDLQSAYASAAAANAAPATVNAATVLSGAHVDAQGRVQVDVYLNCALPVPTAALSAAGVKVSLTVKVPPYCVVEGWVPPKALPALASTPGVTIVKSPAYALHRSPRSMRGMQAPVQSTITNDPATQGLVTPTIDGAAVSIMRADQFVAQTSINGSGVVVGVMSDDATSLALVELRGELPASVEDLTPSSNINPNPTDEGTMMLQEVHAVAPGATLLFCGSPTSAGYLPCVSALINAGATILVDDLAFTNEDMMSSVGSFAEAVRNTLAQSPNVALFSVTANQNETYWEGAYAPVSLASLGYAPQTCAANGQIDAYVESFNGQYLNNLSVHGPANVAYVAYLQWADPYTQNVSNFDLYVKDNTNGAISCIPAAGSALSQMKVEPFTLGTYAIGIGTPDASLAGKFLKLLVPGDGATTLSPWTPGSIYSPQAFVSGVTTVGAVVGSDGIGSTIEPYSGLGPINLSFPMSAQLQAPAVVAPDAVYVDATSTNFVSQLGPDGFFHGTSAAAPNAAAVAALLRSAFPNLTPTQIADALQSGAIPLGLSTPNNIYGYGRVDALGALGAIAGPTISGFTTATIVGGSSSSSLPINIGGTGNLKVSISPASIIPGDSSGVQLSPANCGTGTNVCTVVLTPSMGQSGATTVILTVADRANRTASYQASVTVNKPAAPTVAITSGGSQSVTVNAALQPVSFALSGTGPLTVTPSTNGVTQLAISSGCGTTQMQCTASVGTANSSAGIESLSINATDSYGQAASAKATFNVTQPSSGGGGGGGGSIDLFALIGLGVAAYLIACGRLKVFGSGRALESEET